MLDKLGISASINARVGLGSANATLNIENQIAFDNQTIIYSVFGRQVFSKDTLEGSPKLSETGKSVLLAAKNLGDLSHFTEICGTDVVTTVTRGVNIGVFHSYSVSNSESKEHLKSVISAKYASVSGSISVESLSQTISSNVTTNFQAYQSGGEEGKPTLLDLIKIQPYDLDNIKNKIVDVANSINRNNSPIIEFTTTEVKDLPEIREVFSHPSTEDITLIDEELIRLRNIYIELKNNQSKFKELLNSPALNAEFVSEINSELGNVDSHAKRIKIASNKCLKAKNIAECENDIVPPEPIDFYKYIIKFAEAYGWMWDISMYVSSDTDYFPQVTSWPEVEFFYPNLVNSISFFRGNELIGRINGDKIPPHQEPPFSLRSLVSDTTRKKLYCFEHAHDCKSRLLDVVKNEHLARYKDTSLFIEISLKNGNLIKMPLPKFDPYQ